MKQRLVCLAFIALALVQLAVPALMIASREATLRYGRQYRFRTEPVDPADPFRGRYVALRLPSETVPLPAGARPIRGQYAYALLEEDDEGFAQVAAVTLARPPGDTYIRAPVNRVREDTASVRLPFDRYYTDEYLAPAAERAYWRHSRGQTRDAYITVRVRKGSAVLEELYIAGLPLAEFLAQESQQER